MGRSPCCAKEGLNRGAWTAMEDKILTEYIKVHGEGRWRSLPKKAGLKRCGKSCRLRWLNYLRPDIKRGNITPDEEELIIRLHKLLGNRWSLIAGRLPGRTDNEIKNYWNTNLGKRVNQSHPQANNMYTTTTTTTTTISKQQKKPRADQKSKKNPNRPPPPTQPPDGPNHVVRTKAVRCTNRVFLTKPPQPANSSENGNSSTVALEEENNNDIMEFMLGDFSVGDQFDLIPELLNSDFSDICDFSNNESSSNNNVNDLSPNSQEHPFDFSQELLEDWLGDQPL